MQSKMKPGKVTAVQVLSGLLYVGFLAFLATAIFGRGGAPLLPLNEELDSPLWIQVAFVFIAGFAAVLAVGLPVAYFKIRRGAWTPSDVGATVLFTFAALVLCYVPLSYFYESSLTPRNKFHSHLQLFPQDIPESIPRDDNTIVIAFLGGSTTAWGKWTQQVDERLQAEFPEKDIVVLNQGIQWYTVLHSLINYESNVRHVETDVVVVMHAINDLTVNADESYYVNGSFRRDYGHHIGPLARMARTRPLFDVFADVGRHMFFYREPEVIDTDSFQGIPVFRSYYARLVELIRLDGSVPVLMAQPYLYKAQMTPEELDTIYIDKQNSVGPRKRWSIDTARRGMEQYVGVVRSLAHSEQVPLIDLEAAMPKELSYLKDDCHYTPEGATLVAEHVSNGLAEIIRTSRF